MTGALEVIAQDNYRCGEAPIWDAAWRRLIWTDIESSLTYQFFPETGDKRVARVGHELMRRPEADQTALLHYSYLIGTKEGLGHVVGDHDGGQLQSAANGQKRTLKKSRTLPAGPCWCW